MQVLVFLGSSVWELGGAQIWAMFRAMSTPSRAYITNGVVALLLKNRIVELSFDQKDTFRS
jgi:hypothetical protein